MQIYSLQVEKHVLGGLIKHPQIFAEVERFISEKDFYNEVHNTIYCVVRNLLINNQKLDKILLSEKIKNLGISFKDDINIFDYIDALSFTQITPEAVVEAAKELLKLRIRRDIADTASKIQEVAKTSGDKSVDEIITKCDAVYGEKISSYSLSSEPKNIFADLEQLVEERGNNPSDENGFLTPYPEFNALYGGFRPGNIYAIVSRPGQGKTTWINDICFKTAEKNNIKAISLDTEMFTQDIQFRIASSVTGVPMWYLETGNWRKNPELVEKVRTALRKVKNKTYFHEFVGNKNIDQICSLVRRWHMSQVGRGNPCIIAYDYIKLTGEKVGNNWAEHQAIGDKIDKLKKLSEEIGAPIITAMQLNRIGENFNKKSSDVTDDSSAISLSDRLQWFASFVAIFRRKTVDEIVLDGQKFGTHKLIPIKSRFQGKNAAGHHDLIKRLMDDGSEKYTNNYLNFEVKNFGVEEKGSLRHVVEHQNEQHKLDDESKDDGEIM